MRSLFALIKKDFKGYFDQPIGYILVVVFVGLLSWSFFRAAFLSAEASLRPLFSVDFTPEHPSLPWLLALLVPAATMRLLAEEQRDGTLEILLTQPIRGWVVLAAKFLSGLIFIGVGILATIGIPIALQTAGSLDEGAIVAQYLGSFLLAASFVSIGLFTSSLTRNQIVAFILGLTFIGVLMLAGMEDVADTLPSRASGVLLTLSPVTHFSSISRGLIDLRDILYFVALISTFLSATFLAIRAKSLSHRSSQFRNLQLGVAGLIVVSLLVGWFGNSIAGRLDVTEDKLFTLSPGTKQILSGLDDLLTVELFKSSDMPAHFPLVARDVDDFLRDFANSSDGKVKLVFRSPDDDEDIARRAQMGGVLPRQVTVAGQTEYQSKIVYFGLSMTYADRREIIPFVQSVDGFEYRLASLANRMIQRDRKTVAFLVGHGEKRIGEEYGFMRSQLEQQYDLVELEDTEETPLDLSGVDVLIVAGPTQKVPESVRQALHDYVVGGGQAMVLIDSVVVDLRRLAAIPNGNSFAEFVSPFGVIVDDNLVFDLRANEIVQFQGPSGGLLPYPFWPRVSALDAKVGGDVDSALLGWASSLGISESQVGRVEIIPLLETTEFAAIDFTYESISPYAPIFSEVTSENLVRSLAGVAVTGRASSNGQDEGSFRLIVVGDSDWLTDTLIRRSDNNMALGLNLVDWLAQEDTLASVRSKIVSARPLLFSSDTHRNLVQYANIIGVPLAFVLIGLVVYLQRRAISLRVYGREK